MRTESTSFFSDGLKLSGNFFLPDDFNASEPRPLVMPCSGFTGLCNIHPARFARYLTARGRLCFGFDYRGFADSEGPRGRVLLEEQVRDIRHAAAHARQDPRIDADRIVLLGWGMGAGLVIDAARRLPGVVGLIAANGFYDGDRVQRAHRSESEYQSFLQEVDRERAERVRSGAARRGDPFDVYPLDAQSRGYVDAVLRKSEGYDTEAYSYELAESLLRWNVEAYAPDMNLPMLVAHGDQNLLHPVTEAQSLHDAYGGPKELFWLEGAGRIEQWLSEQVGAAT